MIDLPFLAIKKRLETIEALNLIEFYQDQFSFDDEENTITNLPAAYIQFHNGNTSLTAGRNQPELVELEFTVHLISFLGETMTEQLGRTNREHINLFNAISKSLRGHSTKLRTLFNDEELPDMMAINAIRRTRFVPHNRIGPFSESQIRFKATVLDYSTIKEYQKVTAALDISLNYT